MPLADRNYLTVPYSMHNVLRDVTQLDKNKSALVSCPSARNQISWAYDKKKLFISIRVSSSFFEWFPQNVLSVARYTLSQKRALAQEVRLGSPMDNTLLLCPALAPLLHTYMYIFHTHVHDLQRRLVNIRELHLDSFLGPV